MKRTDPAVHYLRSAAAIRERCHHIFEAAQQDTCEHFRLDLDRLDAAVGLTAQLTRAAYPDLNVPPHSRFGHFDVGGVARLAGLGERIADLPDVEQARILTDLVITSVLLDAGAGARWRYEEVPGAVPLSRSEGLAVASLDWFLAGGLSSTDDTLRADADGLSAVTVESLASAFQVSDDNPLAGLQGRATLMQRLGTQVRARPDLFGAEGRLGGLCDALLARAPRGELAAATLLATVLEALESIWPGRESLFGCNLGDVWRHPQAGGTGPGAGLVPFHKLAQWLCYSLLHPLEVAGVRVKDLDALTGLAEYRNGGLFVDLQVLQLKDPEQATRAHAADSTLIVEWRALTVVLLDHLALGMRKQLGLNAQQLPLAKVLQGGTWAAGRQLARELREDGSPPIRVDSDGTVF